MRCAILWLVMSTAASSDNTVPSPVPAAVPCMSVADCWLDGDGHAIKRPARFRGKKLPRGDCGKNLLWLRNTLTCEQHQCVALHVGDLC